MESSRTFRKVVTAPRSRLRPGFVLALLMATAAGVATLLWQVTRPRDVVVEPTWWMQHHQSCTALEADTVLREHAITPTDRAVCLAVAGRIAAARNVLLAMPTVARGQAIAAVFNAAHPIADGGDDLSAGPIMALVVELWPENYMATFHAGMAEFALGHDDTAKTYLDRFLTMYSRDDVWRGRAQQALMAIVSHTPLAQRQVHFAE